MTINQALKKYTDILSDKKISSAQLDVEVLLSSVLKKPKEYLYTYSENNLTTKQLHNLKILVQRRLKYEPTAYLINNKEFFGLDYFVDKRVLIPRPETEIMVEEAINYAKTISNKPLAICEIGTGSGCIAISLAKHLPQAKIIASDFSSDALAIAKKNANKHKVSSRIYFLRGNLIEPIKNEKIDIICANLPYLDTDMKNLLKSSDSKSIKYEPKISVDGGKDGLNLYRKFFKQIKEYDIKNALVLVEVGHNQVKTLQKYINTLFPQSNIIIKKDLAGLNRVMIIKV